MKNNNLKKSAAELYGLVAIDLLSIILAYMLAVLARYGSLNVLIEGELHFTICLGLMLFSLGFSIMVDWNSNYLERGYFVEFITILKYDIAMSLAIGVSLFVLKQAEFFSRLVYGYFFVFNLLITLTLHLLLKKILKNYLRSEYCRVQVMLVTETGIAEETIQRLRASLPLNYEITTIAILDQVQHEGSYLGIPVRADRTNLMEIARQLPMDEVFIRSIGGMDEYIGSVVRDFESMGVICHYGLNIDNWNEKDSTIGKFGNYTVATYSIYHIDYRRRMIKRLMDIIGGCIGLIFTGILTPFIAIVIKINSRGPVFFAQTRIGKNGRRFKIYKFRSMYQDAEKRKQELLEKNEIDGLMFKIKHDPRITSVGRFLRKSSLDEFPQFYNVLKGDMSLVGTRPPTEDEFEQYNLYYRRRLSMTPGLTGLWQVSGRSGIEKFDDVVKYDLKYIDEWSLSLDVKILLQTIWVVIAGRGSE